MNRTLIHALAATSLFALMLSACAAPPPAQSPAAGTSSSSGAESAPPASNEPIRIGVSGPLTGPNARYGEQWKKGFDLALEEINGRGGINGRPLVYIFEDSQSDPKQSVLVAQKFVADERIIVELGDFSSSASMAASPIYQRAGVVQFGFTNSHPDFTKGGDYMWSNSTTQEQLAPAMAEFAIKDVGLKRIAVLNINNDWGKVTAQLFDKAIKEMGAEVVASEAYLPDEKDFRSALTRVREAQPDGIALISYQADGALIAQQVESAGLKLPLVGASSLHSPDFIRLGGKAAEGTLIRAQFLPTNPDPRVRRKAVDHLLLEFVGYRRQSPTLVFPDAVRTTSPGRWAAAPGMFSTRPSTATTGAGESRAASACMHPTMAAAPDMSAFISSMPAAGLMLMPPESNVTPLPTSTSGRAWNAPLRRSTTTRGGLALPRATPSSAPPHTIDSSVTRSRPSRSSSVNGV